MGTILILPNSDISYNTGHTECGNSRTCWENLLMWPLNAELNAMYTSLNNVRGVTVQRISEIALGRPPCVQDFFKIILFSGNFKGKPQF